MKHFQWTWVAALCLGLWLGGCASDGTGADQGIREASAQPLRVGIAANYPPIAFKQDGELRGVEVDLARSLGDALGRSAMFVERPWEGLIDDLAQDRIDIIMSGMSITPARRQRIDFTEPYQRVGQMALVRVENAAPLARPQGLNRPDLRVGFSRGTTGEDYVRTHLNHALPVPMNTVELGVAALRRREIDAFIHDAPTVWRVGNRVGETELIGLYRPLTEEFLAWAVRKGDTDLREAVNRQLAAWKADGRLQNIVNRWMRVRIEIE